MTRISAFVLAAGVAVGAGGCASTGPTHSGSATPEITGTAEDALEIRNAVARFYASVDQRAWGDATALMMTPFDLDYSSFGGGDPAELQPETIITAWKSILPGFEHTHHQLGNMNVRVESDTAAVACYVTATHTIGDRVWTVVGRYENTLQRTPEGWKLSGIRFLFKYQSGATELPSEAKERASSG